MYETEIKNMNLDQLAKSGQCFRMRLAAETEHGGIWSAAAGGRYVEVMQNGSHFLFSCEEDEFEGGWRTYFDMDTDYEAVKCSVDPEDEYLQAAMAFGGANAALGMMLPLLENHFNVRQRSIRTAVDFEGSRPVIYLKAAFSLTIGQGVVLAVRLGFQALRILSQYKSGQKQKEAV